MDLRRSSRSWNKGVSLDSSTDGYLASKQAAENAGVESEEQGGPDRNHLGVIGDGVDAVHPVNFRRRMNGYAKLGSLQEAMKDVMEDVAVLNKEDENEQLLQPPSFTIHSSSCPSLAARLNAKTGSPCTLAPLFYSR
ncbi:hypothetical protein OIU79_003421 [Salix purpurea]|uniref:Uncharacterized protein n=1 Tax=Salix purpurea TaxID=77065 RepID=A0A9Q0ULL5_SALPP|nr:hypothetical protein OIU79_003421 [Salix purpurea]